jgi:CRISPR-associated protein Csa3
MLIKIFKYGKIVPTIMITQLVFVGHHKERVLESVRALRELPVSKIVLFVGEEDLPGEERARMTAEEIKNDLEAIYDVEIARINKKNVIKASEQLVDLIIRERRRGKDIVINASGSLRTLAIAGYIAACITRSKIFTSIPRYDKVGEEVGIEEIIEVPTLLVNFFGEEQMEILEAIEDGVDSLDELIERTNPGIKKGSEEFFKERSRLSHHITKLGRSGAVRKVRVGRNIRIELTPLGRLLVRGAGNET